MKKKYNIALIPKVKTTAIIQLAQNFSELVHEYLIGQESLPHITLYQFFANDHEIDLILKKLRESRHPKMIDLVFTHFSCITFDNNIFWVSLIPNRIDTLHVMHKQIAEIIQHPVKNNYDPHMTLINTKNTNYELSVDEIKKIYLPITDAFVLSLGESDEIGQYLKVLCVIDENNDSTHF